MTMKTIATATSGVDAILNAAQKILDQRRPDRILHQDDRPRLIEA